MDINKLVKGEVYLCRWTWNNKLYFSMFMGLDLLGRTEWSYGSGQKCYEKQYYLNDGLNPTNTDKMIPIRLGVVGEKVDPAYIEEEDVSPIRFINRVAA